MYKLCCCFKNEDFAKYHDLLEKAEKDIDIDMDIIQFMRKIKMHGRTLSMLAEKNVRRFVGTTVKQKNIEQIDYTGAKSWNKLESLTYSERIGVAIVARFNRLVL